jgi:hypothetical protein
MDNDAERDFTEEAYNRALMHDERERSLDIAFTDWCDSRYEEIPTDDPIAFADLYAEYLSETSEAL